MALLRKEDIKERVDAGKDPFEKGDTYAVCKGLQSAIKDQVEIVVELGTIFTVKHIMENTDGIGFICPEGALKDLGKDYIHMTLSEVVKKILENTEE